MITIERLRSQLSYNSDTGVFVWLVNKRGTAKGGIAGTVSNRTQGKRYRHICVDGKIYQSHRLAWMYAYGELPDLEIDHIDGNGLNNKISNLRSCSRSENGRNQRLSSANKSGVIGVCWVARDLVWKAQIKVNNKHINIGTFKDKFDAICARKSEENRLGFHPNHGSVRPL